MESRGECSIIFGGKSKGNVNAGFGVFKMARVC